MEIIVTERFRADVLAMVASEKVYDHITRIIQETLPLIPITGNNDLPVSISEKFGENVRRVFVRPFLIIYEYDETSQKVYVYGLMHERQAY